MSLKTESIPIPYGRHCIDRSDIEAVVEVLEGDWLTQGRKVDDFENAVADYLGVTYAVVFNSGTSALHAAMHAADLNQGDEIITSPITFVASANAALYEGLIPVFCDISPETYCIDINKIEERITEKTRAIVPVDMAGYPVDIRAIREITRGREIIIIEDAAHALGARRYGIPVGREADMTLFSFHPVKHITSGEGGMIVTDNPVYAKRLRLFRSHGITKDPEDIAVSDGPWYYEMQDLGYNYRITDIQCALGCSQMKKLNRFLSGRNEIAGIYDKELGSIPELVLPPRPPWEQSLHAFHLYPVLVRSDIRKELFLYLREKGINPQVHYIPVHLQPYYRKRFGYSKGDYPHSEEYYTRELSIPMYPSMSSEDVRKVVTCIRDYFDQECN